MEGAAASTLSRKELRKQKLMEYLVTKGKQKPPNPNARPRVDCPAKKPLTVDAVMRKENKVPAQQFRSEASKVKPPPGHCNQIPTRGVFSVSNKGNANRAIQDTQTNVLRSTYTVFSFRPNANAPTCVKKQATTAKPFTAQVSSNVGVRAVPASHNTFRNRSNVALSGPVTDRISLGPLVQTKTGLIPTVTQPRNTNSHLMRTSAKAPGNITATSSAAKTRASCPSASVSQKSSTNQKKTVSTTVATNPVHVRTTVSMSARVRKVEDRSKSNLKPLLAKHPQPPCKSQISRELKSASLSSRGEAATVKPQWKPGKSTSNQSAGQKTERPTQQRAQNVRLPKVTSHPSLGPSARPGSRAVGAAAKATSRKETQSKSGHSSANGPSQQMGKKSVTKVVPPSSRTGVLTGHLTELKTPKVPVWSVPPTRGKKLTAAQEERQKKLQEWREAKGISYKRPPMPVKAPVAVKEEDKVQSVIQSVNETLTDCITLVQEGVPPEQVKTLLTRLPPVSQKFAKYWICQARLMEREGNLDVLPMFKEAVNVVLEPVDELRTVVFEILKRKDEVQVSEDRENDPDQIRACESPDETCNNPMTPEPVRALINGVKGDSSVIKFKITTTPGGPLKQARGPVRVNGQEIRFFTPVRRSVRIERDALGYPTSLQDHDLCVASYNDLLSKEKESGEETGSDTLVYVYRPNEALEDKVSVQLVYDDNALASPSES